MRTASLSTTAACPRRPAVHRPHRNLKSVVAHAAATPREAHDVLLDGFNAKDFDKMAAVMSPDVTFVNPFGSQAAGLDEVRKMYERAFSTMTQSAVASTQTLNVQRETDSYAILQASWAVDGAPPAPPSDNRGHSEGHVTMFCEKTSDGWVVVAYQNTSRTLATLAMAVPA